MCTEGGPIEVFRYNEHRTQRRLGDTLVCWVRGEVWTGGCKEREDERVRDQREESRAQEAGGAKELPGEEGRGNGSEAERGGDRGRTTREEAEWDIGQLEDK